MNQLGGDAVVLTPTEMQIGRGETIADTARVLSRYVDGVMMRTNDPDKLDELARIVATYWPEEIAPDDLGDTRLIARIEQSWLTLVDHLQLSGDLLP